jgi:hypothetical protein
MGGRSSSRGCGSTTLIEHGDDSPVAIPSCAGVTSIVRSAVKWFNPADAVLI